MSEKTLEEVKKEISILEEENLRLFNLEYEALTKKRKLIHSPLIQITENGTVCGFNIKKTE